MKLFITSNSNVGLRVAECSCQYFFSISCSYTNFSCQNTPTKTKMSTNRLFRAELCLFASSVCIIHIYMRATHTTHNLLLFLLWISSFDQIHNNNHMKMRIKNINCVFFFLSFSVSSICLYVYVILFPCVDDIPIGGAGADCQSAHSHTFTHSLIHFIVDYAFSPFNNIDQLRCMRIETWTKLHSICVW